MWEWCSGYVISHCKDNAFIHLIKKKPVEPTTGTLVGIHSAGEAGLSPDVSLIQTFSLTLLSQEHWWQSMNTSWMGHQSIVWRYSQIRVAKTTIFICGRWEETGDPRQASCKHRENMQNSSQRIKFRLELWNCKAGPLPATPLLHP